MKTKPYNRHETFLAALTDSSITVPDPLTREERYLAKIAGESVTIPDAPYNRYETYLAKLAGQNVTVPTPASRLESFLYKACGHDCALPVYANREELFWCRYVGYTTDGENITIEHATSELAKSALVTILATLDGHTSVTLQRTGKNLYNPVLFRDRTVGGITSKVQDDGSIKLSGKTTNPQRYSNSTANVSLPLGDYTLSTSVYTPTGKRANGTIITNGRGVFHVNGRDDKMYFYLYTGNNVTIDTYEHVQIEHATEKTEYEPYNGIEFSIDITGAGTVYGGTLEVVSGLLTVTHAYIDSYNNEDLPGEWISSEDVYVPGTKPTVGAQVVYKLDEDDYEIYQIQPRDVEMLEGLNNIWSDAGPVSVTYTPDL